MIKQNKKKPFSLISIIIIALFLIAQYFFNQDSLVNPEGVKNEINASLSSKNSEALQAYANKRAKKQVKGEGVVVKLLPDDKEGSQHQRFILKISPNVTLLVAHNIDLAPRINTLKVGDNVAYFGEYIYNDKGGVLHWTHKDPRNRHPSGYLLHNGKKYE